MAIKVNISPLLKRATNGVRTAEVNGDTVGQCLNHLVKQFPGIEPILFDKEGKLYYYVDIFINRENAYPGELAKPVNDGDELSIVLAIGAG